MALCVLLGAAPGASAAGGSGGMAYVPRPEVQRVRCVSACASHGRVKAGGAIRVIGRHLSGVSRIVFEGGAGRRDDVAVTVNPGGERKVTARVPMNAQSGPIMAMASRRLVSRPSRPIVILPPPPPVANPHLSPTPGPRDPGAPPVETGTSTGRLFVGSRGGVAFSYRIDGSEPAEVQVQLVRMADEQVMRTWDTPAVRPGVVQRVAWSGMAGSAAAPEGRYAFRLLARDGAGAESRNAKFSDVQRDAFDLYQHIFPLKGRHNFGSGGARFGAGRAGHTHQGQDVMAACGTPIVAVRGGVVRHRAYQSLAGNYIVIHGAGDSAASDYAYMHLRQPSPLAAGDRVYTGQEIGRVGQTGDASACHLHFEMWTAPGWYRGGHPFDPLPHLREWDRYS